MVDGAGRIDPASLAQGWFEVQRPEPGVFMIVEPLHIEEVKSYLIVGEERALLLDTGMGVGDIRALVETLTDRPVFVVNSHTHWDHIGGNAQFDEIWVHEAEAEYLTAGVPNATLGKWFAPEHLRGPVLPSFDPQTASFPATPATGILRGGETFNPGGRTLEVIHCPGHSPGGIALFDPDGGVLFSTDIAYPCGLYAFSDEADLEAYHASLRRLATLAPLLRAVYPSHCASPMEPGLLPLMRDGFAAILAGRRPDRISDQVGHHEFAGFSIMVRAEGEAG